MDRRLRLIDLGMILTLIWVFVVSSVLVLRCNRLAEESSLSHNENHEMQQMIYDLAKETRAGTHTHESLWHSMVRVAKEGQDHTHPGLWVRTPNGWASPDRKRLIVMDEDPGEIKGLHYINPRGWRPDHVINVSGNVSVSGGMVGR